MNIEVEGCGGCGCLLLILAGALLLLLTSCTSDPLHRHCDDFPPPVPKNAPDGQYPTRKGFVLKDGGIAWRFEF